MGQKEYATRTLVEEPKTPDLPTAPSEPQPQPEPDGSRPQPGVEKFYVVLFDDLSRACVSKVRKQLKKRFGAAPEDVAEREVDIWLESPGGDAHAAYKLILLLRAYAKIIRVVVPDYAKSAATLIALGADEIYMNPWAELGPLDVQVAYEPEGITISALDMANAVEHFAKTAVGMVLSGGGAIVRVTGLSRRDTLNGVLSFVSSFMAPMITKIDPFIVHRSASELRVAVEYGGRLLKFRAGKSASTPDAPQHLVEHFPTHGFVIGLHEVHEMELPVQHLANYADADRDLLESLYDELEESEGTVIVCGQADLIKLKEAILE
jgi:hypothetical protein